MYGGIGVVRTVTPSVFLPFELAVVLHDYAAVTIDDQINKERRHWKIKDRQTGDGDYETFVAPVPEPSHPG